MTSAGIRWAAPRAAWLLFGGLILACLLTHPFGELRSAQSVSGAVALAALLAGCACMAISGRPGGGSTLARAGWSVSGTGAFLLALSQGAYLLPAMDLAHSHVLEACVGVSYSAAIPALLAGLVLFVLAYCRGAGLRPVADAACAIGGLCLASWYWVLHPIFAALHGYPVPAMIGASGPLLDLAVTFVAFLLLYLPGVPRSVRTLAAGIPLVALGDTLFALGTYHGVREAASWSELAWAVGVSFAAMAALEPVPVTDSGRQISSSEERSPWSWRATLGVIAVGTVTLAAVSAVLMTEWRADHHDIQWHVVVVCFGLIGVTFAHQVFSIVAHGHVSSQLHGSNQRLEETVAERTRQLHVLHEIVRAATSSLDVGEVLGQILRRTAQALSADATAVWLLDEEDGYPALHLHV